MKIWLAVFGMLCSSVLSAAPEDVFGVWKTNEGGGHVQLYQDGDTLQGKIVGGNVDEAKATTDVNNPDPALRERELLGLVIIKGMRYDADKDAWVDGELYRSTNGKTYRAKIKKNEDGNLNVTGYLGFLSKTVVWTPLPQ